MYKNVLDMSNYRMEKLPKRELTKVEKVLAIIGGPLAIISFIFIMFVLDISFLKNFNVESLSKSALKNFNEIGLVNFIQSNRAMLAIFVASLNGSSLRPL